LQSRNGNIEKSEFAKASIEADSTEDDQKNKVNEFQSTQSG